MEMTDDGMIAYGEHGPVSRDLVVPNVPQDFVQFVLAQTTHSRHELLRAAW